MFSPGRLPMDAYLFRWVPLLIMALTFGDASPVRAELRAGAAKVDIADPEGGKPHGDIYARALVIGDEKTTLVFVAVDAVAIGGIGSIGDDFLPAVRERMVKELSLDPDKLIVNASHCHAKIAPDVAERTFTAIKQASEQRVPVRIGMGVGREERIMENRRMTLKSGREVDVRHAYSVAPDEEIVGIGPVDPDIGIVRIDRMDGRPLATLFQFACHPIQGVPGGKNTSDLSGFAAQLLEDSLGHGAVALFFQGCGGDINPIGYKAVDAPRDAESLGHKLGHSTLVALRAIEPKDDQRVHFARKILPLPRADLADKIAETEAVRDRLVESLGGTSLNLKAFLPLAVKYGLSPEFPLAPSHRYLRERARQGDDLAYLDSENRRNMEAYIRNIHTMEELTRVKTNLALLRMHHKQNVDAGSRTVDVELTAIRLGEFVLTTFPGELTVRIGLGIKSRSPHPRTFVSGYTNGYIYYAPTAEQLKNVGGAQEDSDCILAPEWQAIYDEAADGLLKGI
jgi:hypothetical protein